MSKNKLTKPDATGDQTLLGAGPEPGTIGEHTHTPLGAATYEATYEALDVDALTNAFALAVMRNPSAAQLLYGDPLQPHRCGDHPSVGAYLAYTCRRLATDYYEALNIEREIQRLAERS